MDQRVLEQDPMSAAMPGLSLISDQVGSAGIVQGVLAKLDPMAQMSSVLAAALMLKEDWAFEVNGEPIDAARIADPECMLPLVMWQVERLHHAALRDGTGVKFVADSAARYGVRPSMRDWGGKCASVMVIALEPFHAAADRMNGSLDFLVEDFFADYSRGLIPWAVDSPSTIIDPSRLPVEFSVGDGNAVPVP